MKEERPLPHNEEAEESVIGTCLIYPESIYTISSFLKPEMFYYEKNRVVFSAIMEILKKHGSINPVAITDHLRKKDKLEIAGGVVRLTQMTERVYTDATLQQHALMIKGEYLSRQHIYSAYKVIDLAYEETPDNVARFAEKSFSEISNSLEQKEPKRIDKCIDDYLIKIDKVIKKEVSLIGVGTGFTSLDRITGGWQPSELIILAARPSIGKTALALTLARGSASLSYPVVFFSMEMSEEQLSNRYLSMVSEWSGMQIKTGHVDINVLADKSNKIANLPIFIDDSPTLTIHELRSKLKKLITRYEIKLVIVDYLQLMKSEPSNNREQEIGKISRGLKMIAGEFNIPVIALAQVNRSVEDRADKKLRLYDLRESGSIEQDADIVLLLNRPAKYDIRTTTIGDKEFSSKNLFVLDIAKNRNGPTLSLPLYHNESLSKITDDPDLQYSLTNEEPPFAD